MSDDIPVIPEEVPEFTGDLEQLDLGIAGVRSAGTSLKDSGSAIHTRFGGLSAYYKAPEAEALFATTAPVATKGEEFATELETVASALDTYAAAVGPLKQKFDQLRRDAIAFRAKIEGDDEWRADGDLVEENNNRRSDINAAYAAFQAAERDCYNKIVALVGGQALVVNDGSDKENMYGYRGEDLNNAGGLPWGDPVEESNPWYYVHEHVWDFAVGFVVDGVWGTIKGLGTLVGFNGWDAAGQAWVGLGKLATGILITAVPVVGTAYWLAPDDKLPSWLRDSRTAVVETGKALIAYDEWGKNPSRAAGAVTFNVLTTIFTGGAGGAVSGAGKAGAIAKAISFAGKAGKIVDPMTYLTKGVGATAVKIGDVMASLRGITDGTHIRLGEGTYQIADVPNIADDLPAGLTPENSVRMETPQGEVVFLDTKTLVVHNADGTVRESLDAIRHEGTAAERGAEVRTPEQELVGAGARVGDGGTGAVGRVGDDLGGTGRVGDNGLPGGRAENLPGGRTDDLGRGPAGSHETPGSGGGSRGGDGPTGAGHGHGETPSGGHHEPPSGGRGDTPAGGHGEGAPAGQGDHVDGSHPDSDANHRPDPPASPPVDHITDLPGGDGVVPPPGAGEKLLATLDDTQVTRQDGLIAEVNGRPVADYLDDLSRDRADVYLQAKDAKTWPRAQTGACVGAVMDLRTGHVVEGINGPRPPESIPLARLHPTLRARYDEIAGSPPHHAPILSHAEVKAANQLLWARTEAGLPDGPAALAEMRASVQFPYMADKATGRYPRGAPFCGNCNHMLEGVPSSHGRYLKDPPGPENWIP
ncbi:hypothetical protein PV755_34760 [Streptomyces caniscabiei]|uniref:YwqJ-like deaminase n=1 Tax=Streptomyces caniscabiei TaxID=2746961 RepID=A0A927LCV7_9ACTN|nr:hypothetical protein [Streptomyces caniscabiei]MBD9728841.1 hypothetical protein [Streptomyces caniscabiei]MDX3514014.1 hypothetical protein [Streptomyces caniscabiei]MDX3723390.1 hypothetical protein [Streptomyces caniscabiei]WEO26577.1 hypothetical protein IHE65_27360 [Streptomyces caniscabiei]